MTMQCTELHKHDSVADDAARTMFARADIVFAPFHLLFLGYPLVSCPPFYLITLDLASPVGPNVLPKHDHWSACPCLHMDLGLLAVSTVCHSKREEPHNS